MATQRGKRSVSSLSILQVPGKLPPPPDELTPDQATIWREVCATKPHGWFTADSYALLAAYCRHIATARLLAIKIDAMEANLSADKAQMALYDHLLKMRSAEIKSMVSLATSMRLTQYSRYKSETAATKAISAGDSDKPWQQAAD